MNARRPFSMADGNKGKTMAGTAALIVAAGRGHRYGAGQPKQYLPLAGRALLYHSARAFAEHPSVDSVRVIIHGDDRALYDDAVAGLTLLDPVPGGDERQDSARLGLESLQDLAPERVLIHDAARPAVDSGTIERVLGALDSLPGAIPALAVSDTLKRGDNDLIEGTVERAGLWRAQTPQGFRYGDILAAHRAAQGKALTDDAAVAEAAGLAVGLVAGSESNVKVTTDGDLTRLEQLFTGVLVSRTGMGLDVHAFGPGDHVTLCGHKIDHDRGLVGHSDADVGLHALVDAVLGAMGGGDIGHHFPPNDAQWKGVDSVVFATGVRKMVAEAGGVIDHLDVTIACEVPKVGPHRSTMTARVAEAFGVAPNRVNVKATTTERLGFIGRGEGIAAMAVATLRLPA
jgi:2-C-methyl-D-erythritol 4-phosphate cytidylyltransferase / 2-C-methyl-D-erythritol 2,4-cyclodiphosphate synthase